MSFWRRLWGREAPQAPAEEPVPDPSPAPPPPDKSKEPPAELAPLVLLAEGHDVPLDRLLSALRACQGTSRERAALAAVISAKKRSARPEELFVAGADLAAQRGDPELALDLLDGLSSLSALMIAADVRADRGELARALTLIERVLARDIDAPGARERHERWRLQLGGGRAPTLPLDAPTVLRAETPETSLRIVGEAGRGGAGTVYEAFDDALGRRVALKVYHRPAEERDKLEREARLAVELAGRGVVRVFDADPGRGWIVMEWAPGGALKRWIQKRDASMLFPIGRWLLPLARALERVHALGMVHADVKPANVLFRAPDDPMLSDFGLAHPIGAKIEGGSFGFLSPERVLGEPLSVSDDVYALGRIVEDALSALERAPDADRPPAGALLEWQKLADAALAPLESRPGSVAELLRSAP